MALFHPFESIGRPYKTIITMDEIKPLGDFTTIRPIDFTKDTYVTFYNEGKVYIEENGTYSKISEWVNPHRDPLPQNQDWTEIQTLIGWRPPAILFSTSSKSGTFKLIYTGKTAFYVNAVAPRSYTNLPFTITFTVAVVENHLPLKTITITDVINRLFEVCEPIRATESPRYYLNSKQAEEFDKIQADEFVFTKQTLRECLQDIGKQIHGEPRAKPVKVNGNWVWEVSFDMYQKQKYGIFFRNSLKTTASETLENYATHLDVNAENLINKQGQIVEPASNDYRSLRVETMGVRVEDSDSALIETQDKIYTVKKCICNYDNNSYDITPYLFEESEYNTQLSTNSEAFPYSRAYGIKYTQGEKNITELFFKVQNGVFDSFKNYAIVNILRKVSGNNSLEISDYTALTFQVTYVPFMSARVLQSKPNFSDTKWEYGSIYTQQSNLMDTQHLGEVLKGAVVRQNNTEKEMTFYLARQCELPKIGELFDDEYYITNVNTEILPIGFKCTIKISKDYNRLSEYIGIPNQRRFSQVSETEAYERDVMLREYVIIGEGASTFSEQEDTMIGVRDTSSTFFMKGILNELGELQDQTKIDTASCIVFQGKMKSGSALTQMQMPVSCASFGNSLSFNAICKDNYSAGSTTSYVKNGEVDGYYQMEAPYSDYYGRLYYLDFAIYTKGEEHSLDLARRLPIQKGTTLTENGRILYTPKVFTTTKYPIIHKDSREQLSLTFQIDFVTNRRNFIIGSGFAKNNPFICGHNGERRVLYLLPKKIPKFAKTYREVIQDYTDEDKAKIQTFDYGASLDGGYHCKMTFNNAPTDGKAWVLCTKETVTQKQVEDTSGQEMTETNYNGGELLFGENVEMKQGDKISDLYFSAKRYLYNRDVWVDKK